MAYELAKRTEDAERRLSTTDGLPSRNGALLTARLQQRATPTALPAASRSRVAKAAMRPSRRMCRPR